MKTEKDFYPGWLITRKQYGRYWNMMSDCAAHLSISQKDARELVHLRAFGENRSGKTINHKSDFDELEKAWAAILDDANIKPQLRAIDQPDNRIRTKIRTEYLTALAVLLPIKYGEVTLPLDDRSRGKCPNFYLAEKYLKSVLQNRFKKTDIKELDTIKRPIGYGRSMSELEMFRDTIARCISQARRKIGITVHDLNILGDIPCDCADCSAGIVPTATTILQPHHKELVA